MWQRLARSFKTAFKERTVGGLVPKQAPQSFRNLVSYSPISLSSPKSAFHPTSRPSSTFWSASPSSKFHSPSSSSKLGQSFHTLPRPPSLPGRITDIGLGTARKFSTARPIFQHLIENVPVAGRAFYELDLDVQKKRVHAEALRFTKAKKLGEVDSLPQTPSTSVSLSLPFDSDSDCVSEIVSSIGENADCSDDYFTSPSSTPVITYLLIPLTPISVTHLQLPPPSHPAAGEPVLLPLPLIAAEHVLHATHAARVSSLLARLHTNRVWEDGVSCEVLYDDSSGLCTTLRVTFQGWTEENVRAILGLAGDNWCTTQEVWVDSSDPGHQSFIFPQVEIDPWMPDTLSDEPSTDVFSTEFDYIESQSEMEDDFTDTDSMFSGDSVPALFISSDNSWSMV